MYSNINSIKNIILKCMITILTFILILSFSMSSVFAATNTTTISFNTLTTRDILILCSISYANIEKISGYNITVNKSLSSLSFKENKMVTDSQLKKIYVDTSIFGIQTLDSPETAYTFLFTKTSASTQEVQNWKIVNYTKINTTLLNGDKGTMSAMTFKKDNDIVISFRGTEVEIGDIGSDLLYGLIGSSGQEDEAQDYALKIAKKYPNSNIYITGWSLGGYLSQFAGAALLNNKDYKDNLKGVIYFNGIGLNFWSNFKKTYPQYANKITIAIIKSTTATAKAPNP